MFNESSKNLSKHRRNASCVNHELELDGKYRIDNSTRFPGINGVKTSRPTGDMVCGAQRFIGTARGLI